MAEPTPAIDRLSAAERAIVIQMLARAALAQALRELDERPPRDTALSKTEGGTGG